MKRLPSPWSISHKASPPTTAELATRADQEHQREAQRADQAATQPDPRTRRREGEAHLSRHRGRHRARAGDALLGPRRRAIDDTKRRRTLSHASERRSQSMPQAAEAAAGVTFFALRRIFCLTAFCGAPCRAAQPVSKVPLRAPWRHAGGRSPSAEGATLPRGSIGRPEAAQAVDKVGVMMGHACCCQPRSRPLVPPAGPGCHRGKPARSAASASRAGRRARTE